MSKRTDKYIIGITNDQTYIFFYSDNINQEPTIYENQCTLVEYKNLNIAINYLKEKIRILEICNNDNKWKLFYYNFLDDHIFNIKENRQGYYGTTKYSISVSLSKARKLKLKKISLK